MLCVSGNGGNMSKKPMVLMILDGYGLNEKAEGNAVALSLIHI